MPCPSPWPRLVTHRARLLPQVISVRIIHQGQGMSRPEVHWLILDDILFDLNWRCESSRFAGLFWAVSVQISCKLRGQICSKRTLHRCFTVWTMKPNMAWVMDLGQLGMNIKHLKSTMYIPTCLPFNLSRRVEKKSGALEMKHGTCVDWGNLCRQIPRNVYNEITTSESKSIV